MEITDIKIGIDYICIGNIVRVENININKKQVYIEYLKTGSGGWENVSNIKRIATNEDKHKLATELIDKNSGELIKHIESFIDIYQRRLKAQIKKIINN